MEYALEQFIDEAIQLELNAAEIYAVFSKTIPEDANFWAALAWEERNHASILKTGKDTLVPQNKFPPELLPNVIQPLIETNRWMNSLMQEFGQVSPDRETTFKIALKIERSLGEQHFQRVMEEPSDSKIVNLFQELCEQDLYHLERIREYMHDEGIGEQQVVQDQKTGNILVVLNDAPLAELLKRILAPEGRVDFAVNGRSGLEKLKDGDYRLIISAIEMPGINGMEFYKTGKEIDRHLDKKILFIIGASTDEYMTFLKDENLRYLIKPSSIDEIRNASVNILEGRS